MKSPQLEDGYTRISNELLEAILRANLSKRELKIVFAVIRKTYGWQKKRDDMSLSQLSDLTRIDTAHVSRAVNELSRKKVLLKQQGKYGQLIELNKKHKQWEVLPKEQGVAKRARLLLPKEQTQKKLSKEIYTNKGGCQNSNTQSAQGLHSVPDDFQPSGQTKTKCKMAGKVITEEHVQEFILHYKSEGKLKADWQPMFELWMRRSFNRGNQNGTSPRSGKKSTDVFAEGLNDAWEPGT